eukprot:279998_1
MTESARRGLLLPLRRYWLQLATTRGTEVNPLSTYQRARWFSGRQVRVVLREDLEGKGKKGEVIEVKPGFARNHLYPTRRAVYATPENVEMYVSYRSVVEKGEGDEEEKEVAQSGMERKTQNKTL